MDIHISFGSVLKESWDIFKKNWLFFVGIFVILFGIGFLSNLLFPQTVGVEDLSTLSASTRALFILYNIVIIVIQVILGIKLIQITLHAVRDSEYRAQFNDFFKGGIPFWKYLATSIAVAFIQLVGFLFLIIPGLIVMVRLLFALYVSVDKKVWATQSIKESWNMTRGYGWRLFGFLVLGIVLMVLTIPAFFITVPLFTIMFVVLYDRFVRQTQQVVVQSPEIEAN